MFAYTGLLEQVIDLKYIHENQSLSWTPPLQLNTSQTIMYHVVVIAKATDQSHEQIIENGTHTETYLDLSGRIDEGVTYNASLWPMNAVGRGKESSVEFVLESRTTLRKLSRMLGNCK